MSVYLITGLTFGFAAAVTPGPLLTYLISQTLNNGWRRTLPAVFSPLITDGPIAVLILLILSHVPVSLIGYLQLTGGIFILYLAYGAFKAWRVYDIKKTVSVQSIRQNVLKAAIVNWLNPNPYLGWSLVLGPLLLKGWREAPVNGIILLVSFYGIMFASMTAIIMLFHAARNLGPKVNRAMIGLSAAALACFGLYQWWSGIKAIW
jgi:threonine/homoserine/homoserine lactone efflux protein